MIKIERVSGLSVTGGEEQKREKESVESEKRVENRERRAESKERK